VAYSYRVGIHQREDRPAVFETITFWIIVAWFGFGLWLVLSSLRQPAAAGPAPPVPPLPPPDEPA
jgi:hypothetical protein